MSNFLNNIGKPELIDKLPEKEFYNLDDDLLIEMGQTAKTHSLKYEKIVEKYSTILQERKIIN